MKFGWFWAECCQQAISTASHSDPTGPLHKSTLLRCESGSDERVTGKGSLAIVEISEEGVYIVTAVEVDVVEVAAVEGASEVVAAVVVAVVVAAVVVVAGVVVAGVVVTAVVVPAVVVTAAGVESRLVVVVVVVKDASKSMASLRTAAMLLIDVTGM